MMRTRISLALLAVVSLAAPASADWTRVTQLPNAPIYSVWVNGDTITAGGDSTVFVSTDGGATWRSSVRVVADPLEIDRVRMRNGRLYAATRRRGIVIRDNLGNSWNDFNQGLVGGFGNSQLDITWCSEATACSWRPRAPERGSVTLSPGPGTRSATCSVRSRRRT